MRCWSDGDGRTLGGGGWRTWWQNWGVGVARVLGLGFFSDFSFSFFLFFLCGGKGVVFGSKGIESKQGNLAAARIELL